MESLRAAAPLPQGGRRSALPTRAEARQMKIMYDLPEANAEPLIPKGTSWDEFMFACLSMLALTLGALSLFLAPMKYGMR
jgi:hypothetical protein